METRFFLPGRRMCLRQRGQAGRVAGEARRRCWLDGGSGDSQEASWPSASSGRGSAHSWGLHLLEMVSCPWLAALKEPHCVSPAKGTSLCQEGDKYLPQESLKQSALGN